MKIKIQDTEKFYKWVHLSIDASHPLAESEFFPENERFAMDAIAMELVSQRHGKRELVDLVRYLLLLSHETPFIKQT